jgi:hypothetical protein
MESMTAAMASPMTAAMTAIACESQGRHREHAHRYQNCEFCFHNFPIDYFTFPQ